MAIDLIARGFAIGVVAGLRSMTAPAAVLAAGGSHWSGPLALAAAGELLVDKLPIAPSRLQPGPLAVRALAGAFCGRELARRESGSLRIGAIAGAAGALAGAYGGYYARRFATRNGRVPDFPIALLEDALAIGLGRFAAAG